MAKANAELSPPSLGETKPASVPEAAGHSRKYALGLAILIVALIAAFFGIRHLQFVLRHEETDDAEVEGDVSPVLPRISGYVTRILVRDNQHVDAGQPLIETDARDLELQVSEAAAALRSAQAGLQNTQALLTNAQAAAAVARANITAAAVTQAKTAADLARDTSLFKTNAITDRDLTDSRAAADVARAKLEVVRRQAAGAETQVAVAQSQIAVAEAQVRQRQADLEYARLQHSYGLISAPIAGLISRKSVQPGQYVQAGQTLLSIASDTGVWIVANYKETQVARMRIGQPVQITVDGYPGIIFRGQVESISGATGARFALLPPDNSSGNFVKVTQRVPVKITLSDPPDPQHPLRLGMSVDAAVKIKISAGGEMAEIGFRKFIITLTVISAAIIELIDISIVNVALSDMSGNLGATLEDVAWVVTAYAIANVIIIPMTSFFAARFGRRNYYIGSILLFTAASMACGQAHSIWELVACRFVQGIGGGALLSTSQAILFETFTLQQRGFAAALFSIGVFIGPTIGPTVGGWIIDNYSWPWIFYINLPIGLGAAVLSYFYIKEPVQARSAKHIDWAGITLLTVGLGALQTVLERGEREDWFSTRYITVLALVAGISLIAFVSWQLVADHPVVDLRVLRSRSLAIAATLTFVLGFALFATVFIVPVFVQRLLGFTAMETGMLFLPGAGVAVLVLPLVGRMLVKGVRPQFMIVAGFAIVAGFSFMLSRLDLQAGASDFFWPIILRAIGLSFMTVPLTQLAVSGLAPRDIPQGVALNNMMRQVGGSFGIAFINTFLDHHAAAHRLDLVSKLATGDAATDGRLSQLAHGMLAAGATPWEAPRRALAALEATVQRQAGLLSYLDAFRLVGTIALWCVPLILLAGRTRRPAAPAAALADSH